MIKSPDERINSNADTGKHRQRNREQRRACRADRGYRKRGIGAVFRRITRVELHLSDTNAERGGADKRWVVEVRPKGLDPIVTTDQAETVDKVVLSAIHKMVHLLETTFGKLSARRDH